MTEQEIAETIDFARKMWPAWRPDEADRDAWRRLLSRINSHELARQALVSLKDSTDWNTPKRAQMIDILNRTGPRQEQQTRTGAVGHPGIYVQCVDHPARPGIIGHFVTMYWPGDLPPMPAVMAAMEKFRAEQQALYGGTWQTIHSLGHALTDLDMMRRRAELRGQNTNPDPPARRSVEPIRQAIRDFLKTAAKEEPF
jgi:hypothetical protein